MNMPEEHTAQSLPMRLQHIKQRVIVHDSHVAVKPFDAQIQRQMMHKYRQRARIGFAASLGQPIELICADESLWINVAARIQRQKMKFPHAKIVIQRPISRRMPIASSTGRCTATNQAGDSLRTPARQ